MTSTAASEASAARDDAAPVLVADGDGVGDGGICVGAGCGDGLGEGDGDGDGEGDGDGDGAGDGMKPVGSTGTQRDAQVALRN